MGINEIFQSGKGSTEKKKVLKARACAIFPHQPHHLPFFFAQS
jgi:hypothetical protein